MSSSVFSGFAVVSPATEASSVAPVFSFTAACRALTAFRKVSPALSGKTAVARLFPSLTSSKSEGGVTGSPPSAAGAVLPVPLSGEGGVSVFSPQAASRSTRTSKSAGSRNLFFLMAFSFVSIWNTAQSAQADAPALCRYSNCRTNRIPMPSGSSLPAAPKDC